MLSGQPSVRPGRGACSDETLDAEAAGGGGAGIHDFSCSTGCGSVVLHALLTAATSAMAARPVPLLVPRLIARLIPRTIP
jgi:hypothetical protein